MKGKQQMADLKVLRPGLTVGGDIQTDDDGWEGSVRIKGMDEQGRPFSLMLDRTELTGLLNMAEDSGAAWERSLQEGEVVEA